MVVLPDYQGIGVGTAFENFTSAYYIDKGYNINLTTTTPALVHTLCRSDYWALVRKGRVKNTLQKNMMRYYGKKESDGVGSSSKRVTYSFNFKPSKLSEIVKSDKYCISWE